MSYKNLIFTLFILVVGLLPQESRSCTTFSIKDKNGDIYFGRNFDWPIGLAHVQINQRNIQKTSFISVPEKPFSWTSKYGSISFNQCGREFPYGGMNEAGLVIEQMMYDDTKYPPMDSRYGLEELQWIQYQLDVSATVDDVIKSDALIRVSFTSIATLHFSVADAKGNFATIEYIDGKMVCHQGKNLQHNVLANSTYEASLKYFSEIKDKSKISNASGNINSLNRFAKAVFMIEDYNKNEDIVDYSFNILDSIAQGNTQWRIVYDLKNRKIYYKTQKNNEIRQLSIEDFDFSNTAKKLYCDIDGSVNYNDFKEYNFQTNYNLIDNVWSRLDGVLKDIPFKREWAMYPDDVNNKSIRKYKHSAARNITELLKYSGYDEVKPQIQKILEAKDDYYYAEMEFVYNALNLGPQNLKKALELLKIVVELFPESSNAHYWLGKGYVYVGDEKAALKCFEKSVSLDPNNDKADWALVSMKGPEKQVIIDQKTMESYVGVYGVRKILMENNKLYYQRGNNPKTEMIPLSQVLFMFKEIDYFRIKMVKEGDKVIAIEGIYDDGRISRSKRTE